MQRPVELLVGFELAEIRQHAVPTPSGRAHGLPLVVIVGGAPVSGLVVDAGSTAHYPALVIGLQVWPLGRVVRNRLVIGPELRPLVFRVGLRQVVAVEDISRCRARRRIHAGFDQKDLVGRVGRQPVSHHTTGRATPHDDIVKTHRVSPPSFDGVSLIPSGLRLRAHCPSRRHLTPPDGRSRMNCENSGRDSSSAEATEPPCPTQDDFLCQCPFSNMSGLSAGFRRSSIPDPRNPGDFRPALRAEGSQIVCQIVWQPVEQCGPEAGARLDTVEPRFHSRQAATGPHGGVSLMRTSLRIAN